MRALYATDLNSKQLVTAAQIALWQVYGAVISHTPYSIAHSLFVRFIHALRPLTTSMWRGTETDKADQGSLIICDDQDTSLFNCRLPNLGHWSWLGKQNQTIIELRFAPLLKGKSCNGIRFTACFLDNPIDSESHYFFLLFKLSNAKETAL